MVFDALAAVPKARHASFAKSGSGVAPTGSAAITPISPTLDDQITFLSGVTKAGVVAPTTFLTWNNDTPATYDPANSTAAKWGGSTAGTAGGTETYFFDPAAKWTPTEKTAFTEALALWSAVANVQFAAATSAATANLTFKRGGTVNGVDSGAFESAPNQVSEAIGSTTLNTQGPGAFISINTSDFGWQQLGDFSYAGGYGVTTAIHEEGHFLGLGHDGPYNGNVNAATDQYSVYDTRLYSLMSYIEPETTTAKYFASYPITGTSWLGNEPTTWMPDDIIAIQRLYGAATNTPLSGGQVFGYNTNITGAIKPFFDFTVNTTPVITLWDAGTGNTLDLSGCTTACIVNLNAGTYSSFDGMVNNLAIAAGTAIDGFVGGSDNDTVTINGDADTIDGGTGVNSVVFGGTRAQYSVALNGLSYTVTRLSNSIADAITNVQNLIFTDQTLQTYYNADTSVLYQVTVTKLANGNVTNHFANGSFFAGKSFAAFDNVTTAGGTLVSQTLYNSAGKTMQTSQFNANGSLYVKDTVSTLANGNIDYHFAGGSFFTGKSFAAFDNVANASGLLLSQTLSDGSGNTIQQTQFNANGSINLQDTVSRPATGQVLTHFAGGTFFTGKAFSAFDNLTTTGGTLLSQELYNNDGSHGFTVPGSNLTLTAAKNDSFNVSGSNDTVRFNATGFGADVFNGFKTGDIFSVAPAVAANYAALTVTGTSNAVITDAANDTLTLNGVAASSVNATMFKFA